MATLVYELLDDLQVVLNRNVRPEIAALLNSTEEETQFNELCRRLNRTRDANVETLGEIRNNVAAHRDHDVQRQLEVIASLNDDSLLRLGFETSLWLGVLESWSTAALLEQTRRTAPDLAAAIGKTRTASQGVAPDSATVTADSGPF
jgi:hypothetical protein